MSTRADVRLEGEPVTVMGLGLFGGGAATARFLASRGARVTVTDLRDERELAPALAELRGLDLRLVLGAHEIEDFVGSSLVVANPAVPPDSPFLEAARASGVPVTSEIALFLERCPARVIAVTGTQGKSSTTSFVAQLARAGGRRAFLGGNIGASLLDHLDEMGEGDLCAVELSSYQLERLPEEWGRDRSDSPVEVAIFTNLLTDHLERHGTREAYVAAKLRLLELIRPTGVALLPADGVSAGWPTPAGVRVIRHPGPELAVQGGEFRLGERPLGRVADAPFAAEFLRHDLLLALGAAHLAGVPAERLSRAIPGVRGLPHRLDPIGEIGGRRVWDNAVSTTPDSTLSALETLAEGTTLIVGGKVKDLDLGPLLAAAADRRTRVVIFGAAREAWAGRFRAEGLETALAEGPRDALEVALALGTGEILFSPACASFDAYPNFRARALEFQAAAEALGLRRPDSRG